MSDISPPGEGGKPLSIGLGALLFIVALVVLASVFAHVITSGEGQGTAVLEWMKEFAMRGAMPTPAPATGAVLTVVPLSTPTGAVVVLPVAQPPASTATASPSPTATASLQPTLMPTATLSPTARATGSPVPAPQITLQRPTRVPRP